MDANVILLLAVEGVFAMLLLYKEDVLRSVPLTVAAAILIVGALTVRGSLFSYETLDYQNFLSKWVAFFAKNGGFAALGQEIGNYNIPYLYFLAAFSYFKTSPLYLIKLLSVFFDILLAYAVMKLVGLYRSGAGAKFLAFVSVLYLPTVVLNGSCWAQCDSIYAALAVLGLYQALDGKPALSMISIALSFAFKLQAVFIMPVYMILFSSRRIKWQHFLLFPLTYVAAILPAVLLGRPFVDTLLIYVSQAAGTTASLSYNAPSIFAALRGIEQVRLASVLAITAAAAYTFTVIVSASRRGGKLSDRGVLGAALLLCAGIPFLLPHMHDRYFFLSDVLCLAAAVISPWFIPGALLAEFASYNSYYAYLRGRYLLYNKYGAAAMILVLALSLIFFLVGCREKNNLKKAN